MAKNKLLTVLSDAEQYALYGLPDFDDRQQLEYLSLSEAELTLTSRRPGLHAQVCCVLQISYFKAKHAFFRFTWDEAEDDCAFVMTRYFNGQVFEPKAITKHEYYTQRTLIAELFGYRLTTYKVARDQPVPVRKSRDFLSAGGMGHIEESVYTGGRWKKSYAQTYRPEGYCEEALWSAGETVLQGHRAKNYANRPLCSLLPGTGRVGVWFTLMPTLKPDQAQWDGSTGNEGDWGVYMAVADILSEALLAQYVNPAQFTGNYASAEASELDANTFARIGSDPVWALTQGVRGQGTGEGQGGGAAPTYVQLNLFRWNQRAKRIDNILVGLVTRTEAGGTVTLRKLMPLTTRHNGLTDLVVEEMRFAKPSRSGPLPSDAQKQRWLLQFDGDRYPLPAALTQVP